MFEIAVEPVFTTRNLNPVCWLSSVPFKARCTFRPVDGVAVNVGVPGIVVGIGVLVAVAVLIEVGGGVINVAVAVAVFVAV